MQESQEMQVRSLDWEDLLEEGMATHSSILAWRIHGQRSLVGYSPQISKSQTWLSDFACTHTRTGGWVPQDGISALTGRDLRDLLPLPATWGWIKKVANCKAGEDPHQDPDGAGTLLLDFQPPKV